MDLVTHSVLVMSAVALTLGLLYLRFWVAQIKRTDFLFFSLSCFTAAIYSWLEIGVMGTDSVTTMNSLLWWAQIVVVLTIISGALFLKTCLNGGRRWLFWPLIVICSTSLLLNIAIPDNATFREVTSINHVNLLQEKLSVPFGPNGFAGLIDLAALALFVVFCFDFAIAVWKRGEHFKSIVFGSGVSFFAAFVGMIAVGLIWFPVDMPLLVSPSLMLFVVATGYELNYEVYRRARSPVDSGYGENGLRNIIEQLHLTAATADVGAWISSIDGNLIWASEKWYALFELDPSSAISCKTVLKGMEIAQQSIEPDLSSGQPNRDELETEYRVSLKNGNVRWIRGTGKTDTTRDGTTILRGVAVDITRLKIAQQAAQNLSRKLINAQERERARLARELHDGMSQSLALLSIQLHSLADPSETNRKWKSKLHGLTTQIEELSTDLHRISHELHPAKLEQLGLESALRSICREMAAAHRIKIDFEASDVPRDLTNDVCLCAYRITQEALQNIVKHSGASNVNVKLQFERGELILTVSDNGSGFVTDHEKDRESLGLVSMNERLAAMNGKLKVDSERDAGTKVTARIPYP